jgi:hypothetical protein
MAAGFLFFRYERWFRSLSLPRIRWGGSAQKDVKPRYRVNVGKPRKASPAPSSKSPDLREEVDRILDKINSSGFGSLTNAEKETLNQARELLRK